MLTVELRMINMLWGRSSICFKYMSFWCLFYTKTFTPNDTSLKYRCPAYLICANCVSSHWTRNNSTLYSSDLQRESSMVDPMADAPAADNFNSQGNSKFYETPVIKNIRLWPDDSLCKRWQTTCSLKDDVERDAFSRAAWSTFIMYLKKFFDPIESARTLGKPLVSHLWPGALEHQIEKWGSKKSWWKAIGGSWNCEEELPN